MVLGDAELDDSVGVGVGVVGVLQAAGDAAVVGGVVGGGSGDGGGSRGDRSREGSGREEGGPGLGAGDGRKGWWGRRRIAVALEVELEEVKEGAGDEGAQH